MKVRAIYLILIIMVILPLSVYLYPGSVSLNKVSQWGTGDYKAVAVKGNYAFCGTYGAGMDVIDIANPSNPVRVAGIDLPVNEQLTSIAISGNYAYLGGYRLGLNVVDISNPLKPVFKRMLSPEDTTRNLLIHNKLLLYCGSADLAVFDISNPGLPVKLGSYRFSSAGSDYFAVSGNYVYAISSYYGLNIIDISNPAAPSLVYTYKPPNPHFWSVAISGAYLYITQWMSSGGNWIIMDITNPTQPVIVKEKSLPYSRKMIINGRYAYFSTPQNGVCVADLADPLDPLWVGSLALENLPDDIHLSGSNLFIADYEGGLVIADISSPTTPTQISNLNEAGIFFSVLLSNNYAYLSGYHFRIFDISQPAAPVLKGSLLGGGDARYISGNYVYLRTDGFKVMDVSNPSAPQSVYSTSHFEYDETYDLSVSGDYLFLSDGDDGFVSYDISDPPHPKIYAMNFPDDWMYLNTYHDAKDIYLYVESGDNLYIYDISQPPDALGLSVTPIPGQEVFVDSTLKYLYVDNQPIIKIVDISDPGAPRQVGSIDIGGGINKIYGDGKYIYMATQQSGILVYDITNPAQPLLAGQWTEQTGIGDLALRGNYLYVTAGNKGIFYILKILKGQAPSISVTSPNGGEIWKTGATHNITWTSKFVSGQATIAIYKDNILYSTLGTAEASAGTFSWTIPADFPAGNDYKIRVYKGDAGDYSDANFSIEPPAQIYLNRTTLYFKSINGKQTSPQTVTICNAGGGALNWTAQPDQPWVQVTPGSGVGNKKFRVNVEATGLANGSYTAIISIIDPAAGNSPQTIEVNLTVAETGTAPFGEISSPAESSPASGSIPVTGWALDDVEVTSVKIYREPVTGEPPGPVYIGDAVFVEGARPDVETLYPGFPFSYRAGWGYMLLTNMLPNSGNGAFILSAAAADAEGNTVTLGSTTIICDNAHAVKPFGAIDTPPQGGTASGSWYVNFGWALTPLPNTIPIDGSTINVWVDGKSLGRPVYNLYRADIAELFPVLNNSNGAVGYFYLNTKKYNDGVHTISWTVKDNAGNEDGIGSRYFTITNNDGPTGMSAASGSSFKGWDETAEPIETYPDETGIKQVDIDELGRIEISLPGCIGGNLTVGHERQPLPIGSTLDTHEGVFYWQPGPAFIGTYRFEFLQEDSDGVIKKSRLNVHISTSLKN
ncbi:MAG: hypothetical protein NT166_12710 [Candidatus Aminicenantes bacterium]|nr:hypothetical protein [Candidatus Aminicenantes bacterium]